MLTAGKGRQSGGATMGEHDTKHEVAAKEPTTEDQSTKTKHEGFGCMKKTAFLVLVVSLMDRQALKTSPGD